MTKEDSQILFLQAMVLALSTALACASDDQSAIRCKLGALEELPDDPALVTVSDVVQVVEHVKRCSRDADAGG